MKTTETNTKFNFCVALTAYQEREILERQFYPRMSDIKIPGNEIVQFDGMFENYFDPNPKDNRLSYDGTIAEGEMYGSVIEKIPEKLSFIRFLNWRLYTLGKMNIDCAIMLDADEYLTGSWIKFKEIASKVLQGLNGDPMVGYASFKDHDGVYPKISRTHKIIFNPKNLVIQLAHYIYLNKKTGWRLKHTGLEDFGGVIPNITIHQDSLSRPDWRERWNCKWQTFNRPEEIRNITTWRKNKGKITFDSELNY